MVTRISGEFLNGRPSGSEDLRDDTLLSIEKLRFTGDASDLVVQFNAAQFAFAEVDSGAHPGNLRTVEIFMDTQTLFDLSAVTVTGFVGGDTFRIYGDGDGDHHRLLGG
ncbi:MAG: hypothetical protein R3D89_12130 [Sphingomonadaceae bacterium]